MPSAWIIGPLIIKSSLILLIGSFVVGFIFFRFTSPFSKLETKQRIDEIGSILVVFVISLWVGKILTNISTFISDPGAILAYPSDSKAFYVAFLLTLIYGKFKVVKHYQHLLLLLLSWMYVFLSASFVYEFIQIMVGDGVLTWVYIGLLAVLLIIIILLQEKVTTAQLMFVSILGWSLGQLALSIFHHTSVFQFYLDQGFYGIIAISSIALSTLRKRVS
ncbi:hypothetical protein LG329_09360 [Virgibacillus necropolis]|uniref:hypothetical protein n=1 Tax=Virgibacillus necropolis TaxID=163877 RepID=UPI00384DC171